MKKTIALTLMIVTLLSFCGCSSENKINNESLSGIWDGEVTAKELSLLTGVFIYGNDTVLPSQYIEELQNYKLKYRITFYNDKTCNKMVAKKQIDEFYSNMLNVVMKYYEEQGLLMKCQSDGISVQTYEELDKYLKENSSSVSDELSKFKVELKKLIEKAKNDNGFSKANDEGFYSLNKKKESFSIKDSTIIIKSNKKYILTCDLIDDDSIVINKIDDGNYESSVTITLNKSK